MSRKINVGILISGRGSNMESLARASQADDYPARIVTVISNKDGAPGLERARALGIAATCIPHKSFSSSEEFEETIHNHLVEKDVHLICLAGFMRILGESFIQKWTDRIINIHPSLLPDYPGLHPQARALEDGRLESGCTVHMVTPCVDDGPVILKRHVPILASDTVDTLSARILEQEHIAYPEALQIVAKKLLKSGVPRL